MSIHGPTRNVRPRIAGREISFEARRNAVREGDYVSAGRGGGASTSAGRGDGGSVRVDGDDASDGRVDGAYAGRGRVDGSSRNPKIRKVLKSK